LRAEEPIVRTPEQDGRLHHAFDVSAEMFKRACKVLRDLAISIREPIDYRRTGFLTGRDEEIVNS
jgi:hypothetical protein